MLFQIEDQLGGPDYDSEHIMDRKKKRLLDFAEKKLEESPLSEEEQPSRKKLAEMDEKGIVIFINGLRLWERRKDQRLGIFSEADVAKSKDAKELRDYWRTDKNSFGRAADIAKGFEDRLGTRASYYTSGSSGWRSQASPGRGKKRKREKTRHVEGMEKAKLFHKKVQAGEIKLPLGEPIHIVSHSHGGAHAAGFAKQLSTYKGEDGQPLYNIEKSYYITPHQPTDILHPKGIPSAQYSHPSDSVSSNSPWYLPNGGSEFGRIPGVDEFDGRDITGVEGAPKAEGPLGNRGGHNVYDNDYIFGLKPWEEGYVGRRY
ncbi:MAG: hypothetical protein ACFB0B_17880 [Thermonemataceae bacterium]